MSRVPPSPSSKACIARFHHTRGYCWGKRYRWSYDTYPKTLKQLDADTKSSNASDFVRLCQGRIRNDSGSYSYRLAPHRGWRLSSSWGRWSSDLGKSGRRERSQAKDEGEDEAAWGRAYERLEKDTADLYELIKKRIDADPFDALFGRSFLYPNRARATWWGVDENSQGCKKDQQPSGTSSKPSKVADLDDVKTQNTDQACSSPSISTSKEEAASSNAGSSADSSFPVEEFDIDPITLRKIPRRSTKTISETSTTHKLSDDTVDIPIKRFDEAVPQKPSTQLGNNEQASTSNLTNSQHPYTSSKIPPNANAPDWLAQEGFGSKNENTPMNKANSPVTRTEASPRIESTFDRHMRTCSSGAEVREAHSGLTYDAKENKTDDVDLLRASDIRAASGAATRLRKRDELRRQENRSRLEADFAALQRMGAIEIEWKEELTAAKKQIQEAQARRRNEARDAHHEKEVSAQKATMEALELREAGDRISISNPTIAHPEQGEGDMASNVHEFASRERWYKRKAPHASGIEDQKALQFARARSLIREIRGIYEDTYGVIDTKHRQPEKAVSGVQELKSGDSKASDPRSLSAAPEAPKTVTQSSGPLSTKEKIGTMLQQLLDDSWYLQKLLRNPELTSEMRKELFYRNGSMQNASDAIAEALSSSPSAPNKKAQKYVGNPGSATAVIDHQVSQPEPPFTDPKKPFTVYSVLAYDPSNQQVTTAEMSSSSESPSERRLSLSEALSSLTDPAKFLPQLTKLQSQGYEIVSSDTNILVLRKTQKAAVLPPPASVDQKATAEKKERQRVINPVDGTVMQTGNFASSTGFVNLDSGLPPPFEVEEAEQSPSGYKVRRKEDVFSGPKGNRWDDDSVGDRTKRKSRYRRATRRRKTTKRMFWVGVWTAGCCYAVGAITEFLRA
ncbi:MAG: hypothetical protein Q9166_003008 [cf. Caloplaca sp. 2 TL-2023]